MKGGSPMLILISSPRMRRREAHHVEEMFESGLARFHLRKPDHSAREVARILDKLPEKCIGKVVLHRHAELLADYPLAGYHHSSIEKRISVEGSSSRSFHRLPKLAENKEKLDYAFFGPVFESISKEGHGPKVPMSALEDYFTQPKAKGCPAVYALGGIRRKKIRGLLEMGFTGVAILGAVWGKKDPVSALEGFLKVEDMILAELKRKSKGARGHSLPAFLNSLRR